MSETAAAPVAPPASRAGRKCVVCTHDDRHELETALAAGTSSFRAIGRRFSVSPDSMRRHLSHHVAPALGETILSANGQRSTEFSARLLAIADSARDLRIEAEESSNPRLALAAARAEAETLGTLMDRLGIRHDHTAQELEEARDIHSALVEAAQQHPEIFDHLAPAMEKKNYYSAADELRQEAQKIRARLAQAEARALEPAHVSEDDEEVSANEH